MRYNVFALFFILICTSRLAAQDLLSQIEDTTPKKEYVTAAFKSTRVIMTHSMEMLNPGVLDFRILHRFGNINQGIGEFFGLDDATIRLGLDYGISKSLTIGIGRGSYRKELDGFLKFRAVQQATGPGGAPFSMLLAGGAAVQTAPWSGHKADESFTNRLAYYTQLIVGRKFSDAFTLQIAPTVVHRNLVATGDDNNTFAVGTAGRIRLSRRVSLNIDHYTIFNTEKSFDTYFPLSVGFDIETGGHVFQLHFTNAIGMNERAILTETINRWGNGDIQFGFNISRTFQLKKRRID
ncbi:MAG TPA: DUF5777 family beta-barrel protein [Flavisolibacter sp.]|jgi:hypothetical protein|nr:DUF5777 family beta-barrel protein [Flavisolibacter sp.]